MRVLELFGGYGSQALALENIGIDFKSDLCEIDKYAIQAYNQLHGDTFNYGDICKIDETKLPYYDLITYSSPCFTSDTLFLTDSGYKEIYDIKVGFDKVLTHTNTYKTVKDIFMNGVKDIVSIRCMGVRDEQFNKLHDISNTQLYKLAGNSIVVDVLMGIFRNLFIDTDQKGQLQLI